MLEEIKDTLNELQAVELQLINLKSLEEKRDALKEDLYNAMYEHNIDKYTTPNGLVTFTKVNPSEPKTEIVIEFDEDRFRQEQPELFKIYMKPVEKTTKGRKGYLKTTYNDINN